MKVYIGRYPKNHTKEQKVSIRIDKWDTWSMDNTLAHIITPMLKQLKATQHGAPNVDMEDVPEELRAEKLVGEYDVDENYFKRWEYVLDEMIFAFEHLIDDSWEEAYRSGEIDMKFEPCEDNPKLSRMVDGPNHTYKCDYDGMKKVYDRMDNGFRLFGKYYRGLWD